MTTSRKKHLDSESSHILRTARLQLLSARRRNYMRSSSIRKFFILRKVQRCSITSFMKSVDAPEHGRWTHLLKTASKRSARKLEMEKFSARYPVELTLLLQPLCSQRQSATSSPVYSLITVFSVRMKATRSRKYLDRMARTICTLSA